MNPAASAFVKLLTRAAEDCDEGAGSNVGEPLTFVTTGTLTLQQRHKRYLTRGFAAPPWCPTPSVPARRRIPVMAPMCRPRDWTEDGNAPRQGSHR